jgi:hypothetical protein
MPRKPVIIALFFVAAILLWWVFEITRPLPGVESKGGPESWIPWLSLAASIVSLLTGIVTLVLKLIEMRDVKPRRKKA